MDEQVARLVPGLQITGSTSIVTPMGRPLSPAMPGIGRLASIFDARRGVAGGAWLIARGIAAITATALAAFHARLLWERLAAGQMLEPAVVFRWSGALALLVGLGLLRRAGVSLALDRSLAVWLLISLLHWNAGPLPAGDSTTPADSSAILLVLPSTAAALIGMGIALASLATPRGTFPLLACLYTVGPRATGRLVSGWRRGGLSRAPPHAIG
jgi:hypothetical protein